jgi:Leucine-rich repeat (LRR) protein
MACLNVPIVVFKHFDLFESSVWGSMPDSIGNLSSLQALDLSVTQMNGIIPESIGKLSMLVSLRLGSNSWEGVVTEAHFQNLSLTKISARLRN